MKENTVIESKEVFNIVRRTYVALKNSSDEEILNYFRNFDKNSIASHIHEIKKELLFEIEYINKLYELGIKDNTQAKKDPKTYVKIFDNEKILEESPKKVYKNNYTISKHPQISINSMPYFSSTSTNNMSNDFQNVSSFLLEQIILETLFPFSSIDFILEDLDKFVTDN